MTQHFTQLSPLYFEDPLSFDPDRWLRAEAKGVRAQLDRYNIAFSRGSRACIGQNLATAEIYLASAALVRGLELELFETDRSDVEIVRDAFVGYPKVDSRGVRVKVLNATEG